MISLFCADLDHNLLGDPDSTRRFHAQWSALPWDRRPSLVYHTRQELSDVHALISEGVLPLPDAIISENGEAIEDRSDLESSAAFERHFHANWKIETVEAVLRKLPFLSSDSRASSDPQKSTWYLEDATRVELQTVADALQAAGIRATLIYSGYCRLEIVPSKPDRGTTLAWLCQRWETPLRQVLVAGDDGSDKSLFVLPNIARLVTASALSALKTKPAPYASYVSPSGFADGLLEGLCHFGVMESSHRFAMQSA